MYAPLAHHTHSNHHHSGLCSYGSYSEIGCVDNHEIQEITNQR